MILQWLIIGLLAAASAFYLVRMVRRAFTRSACSTCDACRPRKFTQLFQARSKG